MICIKKIELTPKNQKAVDDFIIHDKAKTSNPNTLRNHSAYLRMFLRGMSKDYNTITQRDLDLFFGNDQIKPTTREVMKPIARQFLRFNNMSNLAELIISNGSVLSKPTKGDEAVLTPEEIEKLIEAHHDFSRKALIETFVVTGARKDEIRMLNLGDVTADGNLVWINIRESKTKVRKIPIAPSPDNPVARYPEHLINWVNSRKNEDPSRPLFVSNNYIRRFNGQRISEAGIYDIITDVKHKSGINRKVTPHIFRHTGATYDGATFPESMLCQKYGWVIGSNMARRYCHFNEKQLGEQVLKRAGLKQEETKKGKVCPRCGELNNVFAEECSKCHQILSAKKLMAKELSKEQQVTHLSNRIKEYESEMRKLQTYSTHSFDRIKELEHKMEDMVHAREQEIDSAEREAKLQKEYTEKFAKEHPEKHAKVLELVKTLKELGLKVA